MSFLGGRGDPYYPIPKAENQELFKKYERLGLATPNVWFVGRLATYRYYNMDQIVGQALATFRRINEALPADAETSPARVMKSAAALASRPCALPRRPSSRRSRGAECKGKRSRNDRSSGACATPTRCGGQQASRTPSSPSLGTSPAGRSMNTSSPGITIDGRRILG